MREITVTLAYSIHPAALDAALHASGLADKVIGLRAYDQSQPVNLFLTDDAVSTDESLASLIATSHDPVFLSVDRETITADGLDAATVTVRALKADALPVSLLVGGVAVSVSLTDGVGQVIIRSSDPTVLAISVQNPQNRTTDQIAITAR